MGFADLPAEDDLEGILDFLLGFNGYRFHDSFEACAEAAAQRKRDTIDSIRNELFLHWRASVHQGAGLAGVLDLYRELRPIMVELLNRPT
jgi:hypothetical protein